MTDLVSEKDGFLERLTVLEFQRVLRTMDEFIDRCALLVGSGVKYSSPLRLCVVQQSGRFIKTFHQDRKAKLNNILDSENWRASEVPGHFQLIVDECLRTHRLSDMFNTETKKAIASQHSLNVGGEPYVVVGFVLFH
ncbi:Vacuolar protein sorting-associated protein 54 [Toxocara canis]|uniref:Vacuolar protein sorting-associated protein 54 n=1 Tax=Toxocara canis TaxID=6265 RepID=A0A0B2UPU2_TOXCA|nr:Vacuolar protein sorting-associated protein 54 [Toxocara canis]